MAHFTYTPSGVCPRQLDFDLEDGKLHNVRFLGGCPGNLLAIGKLVEGTDARDTANLLRGNICVGKGQGVTSCADQLALAIDAAL